MKNLHFMAAALLLAGIAPAIQAQDLNLLVQHTSASLGADGVKRTFEFSELVYRRANWVWVERVMPDVAHSGAHSADDHAKAGTEHRHLDVAAAARWISRGADGATEVRLVSTEDKAVVDIARTEYGNIGFDGSWIAAYHLIDPAVLQKMNAVKVDGDLTTYARNDNGSRVTVVWNHRLQFPASVESSGPGGSRKTMVRQVPAPKLEPWNKLHGYQSRDYSDYLD
jgi:hypothetical protein